MDIHDTFWQHMLSPKDLIIDWDKFILLFDEWILQTISLKLNHIQKDFIKSLIDPQARNLVYKNSYLLFVKNFWELPSNRTKLLKGQINLSKMPKSDTNFDSNNDDKVLLKIHYLTDSQIREEPYKSPHLMTQKIFELRKNKVYTMDPKFNIISQKSINTENFLALGRGQKNDICIPDCESLNTEHMKLIKMVTKRKKQKKPYYMMEEQDKKSDTQNHWYMRDISRSNRLQYLLNTDTTHIVMRSGLVVKIGLTEQFQLTILKATPQDISQNHIKQLITLLNTDRINYLGEIDPSIPQKTVIDFPVGSVKPSDIQAWVNKGYHYQDSNDKQIKKKANQLGQQEELPLILHLKNNYTQEVKEFKFVGENIKVGRNSKLNQIIIDRVNIRNVQCQFVCITGIWILKNLKENLINQNVLQQVYQQHYLDQFTKRLKIKQLSVGLSTNNSIEDLQSSNRIELPLNCKHQIGAKNFIIQLSFRHNQN